MDFDELRFFEDKSIVSPGSIGGKIKRLRELRGWSKKELGLKCGYSEATADIRIGQYENNKKLPREKALKTIAAALEVDESALYDADLLYLNRMYHALFDIEDLHGLRPVKISNEYYLAFTGHSMIDQTGYTKRTFQEFLKKWYETRQKYLPNDNDSEDVKEQKVKDYTLWRAEYPGNEARARSERIRNQLKMDRLQAEMDDLNAQMKSDEEFMRLDESMRNVLPAIRSSETLVSKESDLILLIKKMVEGEIKVERFSPDERIDPDAQHIHLLSIRTEELLNDNKKMALYAQFVYGIESMLQYGIHVSRKITSRKGELFITHLYPSSQYMYFQNLQKYWDEMVNACNKDLWPDGKLEELDKEFKTDITRDGDIMFSVKK